MTSDFDHCFLNSLFGWEMSAQSHHILHKATKNKSGHVKKWDEKVTMESYMST